MTKYLLRSEDNAIFKYSHNDVKMTMTSEGELRIDIDLELVCKKDYVTPDYNDLQCFVPHSEFIEDAQEEYINCYADYETLEEVFNNEGLKPIKEIMIKAYYTTYQCLREKSKQEVKSFNF